MAQQAERVFIPSPARRMTYEEFLEWADEDTRAEWVDGEVIELMTATTPHQRLLKFLLTILEMWLSVYPLGELMPPPFQMKTAPHLPGREPDLLFVSAARTGLFRSHHLEGAADLVVEIISPDSVTRDRVTKPAEYQEGGVKEYWLLDPEGKRAEFYGLGDDGAYHLLPVENGVFHSTVLEGCWLRVDWLFQNPHPNPMSVLKEWGLIP